MSVPTWMTLTHMTEKQFKGSRQCRGDLRISTSSEVVWTRYKDACTYFQFTDRGCRRSCEVPGSHERRQNEQMGAGIKRRVEFHEKGKHLDPDCLAARLGFHPVQESSETKAG